MIINMYIFAIDFDYYEENLSSTISDIMYMYTGVSKFFITGGTS